VPNFYGNTVVRIDSMNGWYSAEYTGAVRVS